MADTYLSFEIVRGRERWHFRYINWWRPRRKREQIRWTTKTWPEADGHKADEFVRSYWQKVYRLEGADCFNCGEPNRIPVTLCTMCEVLAEVVTA